MARRATTPDLDALFQRVDQATRTAPRSALTLVDVALGRLAGRGHGAVRARLYRYRGHALRALNDFPASLRDYARALRLFRNSGNEFEAAVTQIGRIQALIYKDRYADAVAAARDARRVFVKAGDRLRTARLDSNTGNIYHRWDRPADALKYYDRARELFAELGDRDALAIVDLNRGNVLGGLARLEESGRAYRSARARFAARGQELLVAEADYGLAYLLFLEERLTDALAAFETLRPRLEQLRERRLLSLCDMDGAEACLRLNLWIEAESRAMKAAAGFKTLEMRYEEARSLAFAGSALLKTARPQRALALWRKSARIFRGEGNLTWCGIVSLSMARLERGRGRPASAARHAADGLALLAPPAPPERRAEALYLTGVIKSEQARSGKAADAARRILLRARRAAAGSGATWLVRDVEESLGELALARGTPAAARRHFAAAVASGERLRSLLRGDDFRAAFFRDRARPYLALARLDLDSGRADRAFSWVERGRSRALLEGLDDLAPARPRADTDTRELEVILRRLGAQYHSGGPGGSRPAPEAVRLPDTVRRHLESRAETLVGRLYPECDPGLRHDLEHPAGVDPNLEAGEALVSYFETDGAVSAFVHSGGRLSVTQDLASAADVRSAADRLAYQWGRFRLGPELMERHARLLLDDALEDLHLLHGLLVRPLGLAERTRWIIIPSRSLASIPFAALFDGRGFVAETTAIAVAPSLGVFERCRGRLARRSRGTLLVGQTGQDTPEVAGELRAIAARAAGPVTRLTGPAATVSAVTRAAPGKSIVHLASHGFFHAERPSLSGIRLADRWMHAHDAARLELTSDLVVLSACQSGVSLVMEGDEWMGLPRAFLRAGSARVLASLWDVDDAATRRLMTAFAASGSDPARAPAEALRSAQARLLAQYRHPYYWAGFQVVGAP